jgi:putative hemolysin
VIALREQPDRLFASVQIGITVVGATAAAYGGANLARDVAAELAWAGDYASTIAFAVVVGGISFVSIVIGELVPKSLALRHAEGYALAIGRPLLWLSMLMRPLVWVLTLSSNLVLRLFSDRTTFSEGRLSADELRELVVEAATSGSLDRPTSEITARAIDFGQVTVRELMVPAAEVVGLPRQAPAADVKQVLLERGHSRMPVYEGTIDHVVGYVTAKDILALAWEQELIILEDIIRPVYSVPEPARAVDVLRELQKRRMQMAVVVDEHGGLAGLVTIEDLVEDVVGEIVSEGEIDRIRRQPDGTALVQGSVPVREVNRELGLDLPESDEWITIAGLVISLAGTIPPPATRVETDGTVLEVIDATARRVVMVWVQPTRRAGET